MKIIVTGDSGFIGSYVVKNLSENHEVKIFNFKKPINLDNEFIQGTIKDTKNVIDSIKYCDMVLLGYRRILLT